MFRVVAVLILLLAVPASAKEVKQAREGEGKFIGFVGCRSSSCHGGAGEKRSQYITWSRQDFHARAYAILLDARSARIAETVGIAEVQTSARCTVCHSPFQTVNQTRLLPTAHPDEGVSCETCHGAAETWLRGHTRTDWTYPIRVSGGMHDLRNLYVRANACVACHQNIDNDLLKAGHPALVFELDSQSVDEPKHWREDDPMIGPRSWLVGQAVALREITWALAKTPPAERSQLLDQEAALVWLIDKSTAATGLGRAQPRLAELSAFPGIQERADEIARDAMKWNPSAESLMSILRALAETDSEFVVNKNVSAETLFCRGKRLVLALDRLTNALNTNRGAPPNLEKELNSLRDDVRLRENFDPARFAEHLRAFRSKL